MSNTKVLSDKIERILYITPKVHVYQIPPLTSSTKGHTAASWTVNQPIFTARMRILETTEETSSAPTHERVTATILLEDPSSGELFAASPYTHPSTVAHCHDSSRFFALRVVGPGESGLQMKATLGIGFEERSDAFDFGVALQDVGKVLGFARDQGLMSDGRKKEEKKEEVKDYSLKEGQTITVNIGGRGSRINDGVKLRTEGQAGQENKGGAMPFLPPPPPPSGSREKRKSGSEQQFIGQKKVPTIQELGFDDGEFGEFQ